MKKKVVSEAIYYIYNDEPFIPDEVAVEIIGKAKPEEVKQMLNDAYMEIYGDDEDGGFTGE